MSLNTLFTTTKVRNIVRTVVASAVGSLVAWGAVKWGSLNSGTFAVLAPVIASGYFAAVHFLEIKFPKLGWLLGLLPQKKAVVPTPAPAPAPAKTATKSTAKAIKAAKKTNEKA